MQWTSPSSVPSSLRFPIPLFLSINHGQSFNGEHGEKAGKSSDRQPVPNLSFLILISSISLPSVFYPSHSSHRVRGYSFSCRGVVHILDPTEKANPLLTFDWLTDVQWCIYCECSCLYFEWFSASLRFVSVSESFSFFCFCPLSVSCIYGFVGYSTVSGGL
ncbi:hypothetical protein BDW66DRAFT_14652 [Aspergillus desertorum]